MTRPKDSRADEDQPGAELVVLPNEPYYLAASDGPEAFTGTTVARVSGRSPTWYGPSLASSRAELVACLESATRIA